MHKPSTTPPAAPTVHSVTSDYAMSQHTAHLLRTYRDGNTIMTKHGDPGTDQATAMTRYLNRMADRDKGITVIDLLTLVDALEHVIREQQAEVS